MLMLRQGRKVTGITIRQAARGLTLSCLYSSDILQGVMLGVYLTGIACKNLQV